MRVLKNILVVVNREDDSRLVLEKVAKLALASKARVFVIRVTPPDTPVTRVR